METTTLIGLIAAFCTTAAFVPQVIQIIRTGNVDGISLQMYAIFTFGVAMWLTYGIIMQDLPMMLANLVTLILAAMVLGLTLRKRLKHKRAPGAQAPVAQAPEAQAPVAQAAVTEEG